MRDVVISDLHFGDPHGGDLLRHEWARERLWPILEGADRLILLGDTFELIFQGIEKSIAASRPLFEELDRRYPGIEIMIVPGNHDHHLVARAADDRRMRLALGLNDHHPFAVEVAERIISHLCPAARVSSAYPSFTSGSTYFHHGHYLASHLEAPEWKYFDRLQWLIWGKNRRPDLTAADYEALATPIYEMCYQVAQLPDGIESQIHVERQMRRIVQMARLTGRIGGQTRHLAGSIARHARRGPLPLQEEDVPAGTYVEAMLKVVENLGVNGVERIVFGHSHEPLFHVTAQRRPDLAFYNTGSWFLDHRTVGDPAYRETYWPGTALIIDGDSVELVEALADLTLAEVQRLALPRAVTKRRRRTLRVRSNTDATHPPSLAPSGRLLLGAGTRRRR